MDRLTIPLKHFSKRPSDSPIDMIVLHYISAVNLNQLKWADLGMILGIFGQYSLSAHYLIERDGRVIELVSPSLKAWHAGKSKWAGRDDCNRYSVGIELVGGGFVDFDDVQYHSLHELTTEIRDKYPIKHIVGHEEIAPGRKVDPGKRFDWSRVTKPAASEIGVVGDRT